MAGAQGRAVPRRGRAAHATCPGRRRRTAAPSSWSSWRARTSFANTRRCAKARALRRASSTWRRSTSSIPCWQARSRLPTTGCSCTSRRKTRRWPFCAGEHLVFFRNRAADGEAGLADMVHQTAMYYEDRLSGAGFRPRGAGRRRLTGARRAGCRLPAPRARTAARRQSRSHRSAQRRDLDGSHYREHANCSTRLRRSSACSRGNGRPDVMLRTNLSTRPFYNERGVHGAA